MPNLNGLTVLSTPQGTIIVICALELILLGVLVFSYTSSHIDADLRTILKDVFIGWNTALALALNSGTKAIVSHPSDNTTLVQSSTTPIEPPIVKV